MRAMQNSERVGDAERTADRLATPKAWSAFTLMELLLVIVIIAILMGVLMPLFLQGKTKAYRAHALATTKTLEIAWKEYYNIYRSFPATVPDEDPLELTGTNYDIILGANANGVVFFEGERTGAPLRDPWGSSFFVMLDKNMDNQITYSNRTLLRAVMVFSPGPDKTPNTVDDVRSWD